MRIKNVANNFVVYPNPAINYITLRVPYNTPHKSEITIYDAVGKQLTSKVMTGLTEKINIANLPAGTYLLKIVNDGKITTQRVLIMRR